MYHLDFQKECLISQSLLVGLDISSVSIKNLWLSLENGVDDPLRSQESYSSIALQP